MLGGFGVVRAYVGPLEGCLGFIWPVVGLWGGTNGCDLAFGVLFIQWLNFKLFSWLGSRARARASSVCFRTYQRRARARANPAQNPPHKYGPWSSKPRVFVKFLELAGGVFFQSQTDRKMAIRNLCELEINSILPVALKCSKALVVIISVHAMWFLRRILGPYGPKTNLRRSSARKP